VPPREVKVDNIKILNWESGEFPELTVQIECRSGTYIRAIARDLGNAVATGGTLAQLRRTASSGFSLANTLSLTTVEEQLAAGTLTLLPLDYPLQHLDKRVLSPSEATRWCQGQFLVVSPAENQPRFLRLYNENGLFLGIGEMVPPTTLKPKTVII
jgi:tRNA pseudouridine55 synthase